MDSLQKLLLNVPDEYRQHYINTLTRHKRGTKKSYLIRRTELSEDMPDFTKDASIGDVYSFDEVESLRVLKEAQLMMQNDSDFTNKVIGADFDAIDYLDINTPKYPEGFRPMLAATYQELKKPMEYPLLLSEKIDGIRAICFGGTLYSRSLKPIPNLAIQSVFKYFARYLEGVDGELYVGNPWTNDVFRRTTSCVMSEYDSTPWTFVAFDRYDPKEPDLPYHERHRRLAKLAKFWPFNIKKLTQHIIHSDKELDTYELQYTSYGLEGVMLRTQDGAYKMGRCGKVNPHLVKLKRFVDEEFMIVGYEPYTKNMAVSVKNGVGLKRKQKLKAFMQPEEKLGAFKLITKDGKTFSCGSGLRQWERVKLWEIKDQLIGQMLTIKHFPVGAADVPRFPVVKGVRHQFDLSSGPDEIEEDDSED